MLPDPPPSPETAAGGALSDCQVALLTPHGRGAVATVSLIGAGALQAADTLFVPATGVPLQDRPCRQLVYGRWLENPAEHPDRTAAGACGEELVVVRHAQDRLDVHCHGGSAATERIVHSLIRLGARQVTPETWVQHRSSDALIGEAQLAIGSAPTLRTASILLDQVHGALSNSIRAIVPLIIADPPQAVVQLQTLLEHASIGCHLTRPWRVALIGPTNAGKSSLINALLGYQRALVGERAGTTRDVLTDVTSLDGWPIELADTAGMRTTRSAIERQGIERARQLAASSDLVLLVTSLGEPWSDQHRHWLAHSSDRTLLVHNKVDLPTLHRANRPRGIETSARTTTGLDRLVSSIVETLVPKPPSPGAGVPFLARHARSLRQALEAVQNQQSEWAQSLLQDLLVNHVDRGANDE